MKKFLTLIAATTLTACSAEMNHGEGGNSHAAHQIEEGIVISSARVRPPLPGRDVAAGYMSVTNHTKTDDTLISVTSPMSDRVEIHTHLNEDGVMKMRQVQGVDIKAGETVEFKPGSYHLMMFGVSMTDGQEDVSVTLNYKNAPSVTMIIPVEGQSKKRYGSDHDGH